MSLLSWCRRLALGLAAGTCLVGLVVAVAVPRLAGATPYVVLTGSMAPDLPPGTLVVVRPTAPDDIGIGSVVTYQLESGRPAVVTHRVVSVRTTPEGGRQWQTKGDANADVDQTWVREEQVRGTVWYAVPYLGRVTTWLSPQQRRHLTLGIALLLCAYAVLMFSESFRRRSADRRSTTRRPSPCTGTATPVDALP